jgi:hypothetical protein
MTEIDDRVKVLEIEHAKQEVYVRVAIVLATIFGIGGGWGWTILHEASASLVSLGDQARTVEARLEGVSTTIDARTQASLDKQVPEVLKDLQAGLRDLQVPVGTVLAVCENEELLKHLGPHWQVCDGSEISDPESPFISDLTLRARTNGCVPNLSGRFILGTTKPSDLLAVGGNASLPDHQHSLDLETGGSLPVVVDLPAGETKITTNKDKTAYVVDTDASEATMAHHTHRLAGDSGSVEHPPECLPPYCKLTWIIRIK